MSAATGGATSSGEEEDNDQWEICSDNGFVYKRRCRCREPDTEADASQRITYSETDTELHRQLKRGAHRKRFLLSLLDRYKTELAQWENLSSCCVTSSSSLAVSGSSVPTPPTTCSPATVGQNLASSARKSEQLLDDLVSQYFGYVAGRGSGGGAAETAQGFAIM